MTRTRPLREALLVDGPVGPLQAVVERPAEHGRAAIAVVCHPHPLHGGTLDNKITHTLSRALSGLGVAAVRFNFRGVGESAGHYDGGRGELEDTLAVLDWAARRQPAAELWLAGFSFGGCMALAAAGLRPVRQLIVVAPPVERCPPLGPPACPWLVIQGDADEVVSADAVAEWAQTLPESASFVMLPDTDHFFHGRLTQLRQIVEARIGAAAAALPSARTG